MAYCNITTDLSDQIPDIGRYMERRILRPFFAVSGSANTYACRSQGQTNMVFDDGEVLALKTSIATVQAAAGSWWYDVTVDTVYVHAKGSDNLTTATITIEAGEDWDALLTRINNRAYNQINGYLNPSYPTPVAPRIVRNESTDDYDYVLIKANALLTCSEILRRRATDDVLAEKLAKMVWNSNLDTGEEKGLLNQLRDGDIVLTDQITARETGSFNYWPNSTNTSDTPIWIYGKYTGETYQRWKLEFDNTAATGTATFKLSRDGGTTWDLEAQKTFDSTGDDRRMPLLSGLSAIFDPDTTNDYTDGDFWTIEVFPQDDIVGVDKIGNARAWR